MPSRAELVCVDPSRVSEVWPHASRLIRAAVLRAGVSDFQEIERRVLCGQSLLWLVWNSEIEAAVTTELSAANGRKLCTIVACGGSDRDDWLHLIEEIEDYARAEGCEAVHILGRKGWSRVLNGYAERLVLLEKELD
jgi:hypothetical protein